MARCSWICNRSHGCSVANFLKHYRLIWKS
ncbi:hypothetical protein [Escherichia phage CLB_P2]|nr:hypothetical protein [Escherichia phage CLB_P2]